MEFEKIIAALFRLPENFRVGAKYRNSVQESEGPEASFDSIQLQDSK